MQDNGRRTCAIGSSVVLLIGMIILVVALEPKSTAASAGALGLMAAAILDIVFYFLFANETDSGFSAFIKNALYYILVVVEILVGLCVAFLISQEFEYTEIERDSTWLVALAPAFAFGVILKPVFYRLRANVELTPFISILSHAAGYLVGLLLVFIGNKVEFILDWGVFIVFVAGLVVAFKKIFVGLPFHVGDAYNYSYDDDYDYDDGYGSSNSSSSSSSYGSSSSSSGYSSGTVGNRGSQVNADNYIYRQLEILCNQSSKSFYYDSTLHKVEVDVDFRGDPDAYYYILQYDIRYHADVDEDSITSEYDLERAKTRVKNAVSCCQDKLQGMIQQAKNEAMAIIKRALENYYPEYNGNYSVSAEVEEDIEYD